MRTTWLVEPDLAWIDQHLGWFPEANLLGVEQCPATLAGTRCALIVDHSHLPHVVTTRVALLSQPPAIVQA